ncbi:MAG: heavy-metal-associated domain-containing protein [Clostridiales bacterium]|jgi:heavy-metal-associated domain family protein|nr:heavy-metal-associated domain-containing protein [Clostridiales bacterium]
MEKNNKIEIRISGMSCTGCENRVENVLKNIENVESVNANYNTGIVEIETNNIKDLDMDMIKETLEDLGYDILEVL